MIDPTPPPESAGPGLVVALVGATATGKSDLSLDVAEALGGEVIGADASQLYRGMDIGTAKLPAEDRRGIPHHQLDVLDLHEDASVAAYQRHARADLDGVRSRGHVPLLVGGSGLYVRAALDRLDIPPTDPGVRARWEDELARVGVSALRERLAVADPAAAAAIDANNARRIVRALEVIELTGRPFSATLPRREYRRPTLAFALAVERDELDRRIDARTREMFEAGLVAEVEGLARLGLAATRTASRAVGYRQVLDLLDGRLTRREAIEETARATRRLARRQERWFGADPRVTVLSPADARNAVLAAVEAALARD